MIPKTMPKHWKFSVYHNNKLEEVIKKELNKFSQYSDDEDVLGMLNELVKKNKVLWDH